MHPYRSIYQMLKDKSGVRSRALWQESSPSFESRLKAISVWLSDCECRHTRCVEKPSVMPRRLLDLKEVETSKMVRLVETSTTVDMDARYATLSHCWGPMRSKPPLITTSENINRHYKGISSFPETTLMHLAKYGKKSHPIR